MDEAGGKSVPQPQDKPDNHPKGDAATLKRDPEDPERKQPDRRARRARNMRRAGGAGPGDVAAAAGIPPAGRRQMAVGSRRLAIRAAPPRGLARSRPEAGARGVRGSGRWSGMPPSRRRRVPGARCGPHAPQIAREPRHGFFEPDLKHPRRRVRDGEVGAE